MKKYYFLSFFLLAASFSLFAQTVYYDASRFPLLGKVSDDTETRYERLPAALSDKTRGPVWALGKNTAGLVLRFNTNSSKISLKWSLLNNSFMNHMAMAGIKGFDLYCLNKAKWEYVMTARPGEGKDTETTVISNMDKKEREYMLYFPLYDGVTSLSIGIDSTADISQPKVDLPQRSKPVVCYGTSILQGGCASRPGMAHTNILSRWFNREFINLGFSGNGQLDYEIAEIIADVDASLFILDFVPNVNVAQIEEKMEKFYSIIRAKNPDTHIMFIENPVYPYIKFDTFAAKSVENDNKALHEAFDRLKKKGEKNISLVSSEKAIGTDGEGTVDGVHFTDLGFMRYAEYLYPLIKKRMK